MRYRCSRAPRLYSNTFITSARECKGTRFFFHCAPVSPLRLQPPVPSAFGSRCMGSWAFAASLLEEGIVGGVGVERRV
jgi:hypothetical protein